MLMIKDLEVSRELDAKAMSAVRGGIAANFNAISAPQAVNVAGGHGPTITNVVGPVINNTSTAVDIDMSKFSVMGYSNPHGSYDYGSGSSGYGSSDYGSDYGYMA
jgi:hypothetical protein